MVHHVPEKKPVKNALHTSRGKTVIVALFETGILIFVTSGNSVACSARAVFDG